MTINELQVLIRERWGSASYRDGVDHKNHAALHLMKALGKVAAMLEQYEHRNGDVLDAAPQLADLVICAVRLADLEHFVLQAVIARRIADKFPIVVTPTKRSAKRK